MNAAVGEIKQSWLGWVKAIRVLKERAFLDLSFGNSSMQVLVPDKGLLDGVHPDSCIRVRGHLEPNRARNRTTDDIIASNIEIVGPCPADYPIQRHKSHDPIIFLRTVPHLRLRTDRMIQIVNLRNNLAKEIRKFLDSHTCIEVQTPIMTANDCENAGETFEIAQQIDDPYFDRVNSEAGDNVRKAKPVFLTCSAQLHLEAAASALGRVYTFGPVFRAEKQHTSRHLSEFWMLEVELSFVERLEELMNFMEDMVKTVVRSIPHESHINSEALNMLIDDKPFERISFMAARELLDGPNSTRTSVGIEEERRLCELLGNRPVFMYNYPRKSIPPFYMKLSEDGEIIHRVDLLLPNIGEVCGGSLREENLERLKQSIESAGINQESLDWYCDLRKYGSSPHAGFGVGFDRIVQFLSGEHHIKDVVPFPRSYGHILM